MFFKEVEVVLVGSFAHLRTHRRRSACVHLYVTLPIVVDVLEYLMGMTKIYVLGWIIYKEYIYIYIYIYIL